MGTSGAGESLGCPPHNEPVDRLIGRQGELDRVTDRIDKVVAGAGGIILIEGEPGIGKTAMLRAAAQLAAARGLRVLHGAAKELERYVPFAAIEPLRAAVEAATTAEPRRGQVSGGAFTGSMAIGHEMAAITGLLDATELFCATGPFVLLLDDAHWADPSSLRALRRLGELLGKLPLLLVLAVPPLPRQRGLSGLLAEFESGGAELIRLEPLRDSDIAVLVELSLGTAAGPLLSAAVASAGGNPLYVTELVTGMSQAGMLESGEISSAAWSFEENGSRTVRLPESLTEAILRRLDHLPARSRQILSVAAALGLGVEAIELSEVLAAPLIDVWHVISAAVASGILVRSGAELTFRHDLIRQVLADQLPPASRTTLQSRAARVLMSMEAPVERVAMYLLTEDGPLDATSLEWLKNVVDRLMVRAPELAAGLLARAIESSELDPQRQDELRLWQIRALLWSGNPTEAQARARHALSLGATVAGRRQEVGIMLHWLLAHACFATGNLSGAVEVAESVLAQPGLNPLPQGQFHGFRALSNLLLERFDIAEDASAQAMSAGLANSDPVAWGLGSLALGLLRFHQGFLDEARQLGDRLARNFESNGRRRLSNIEPYSLSGRCLTELDEHPVAEKALTLAIRYSEHTSGVYLGSNRLELARSHFLRGRWDETLIELRACRDAPDVFGYLAAAECLTALVAVHRGTFAGTPDSLPAPDTRLEGLGYRHLHPWVRALVYETQGDSSRAMEILVDLCEQFTNGSAPATVSQTYPDLVRMAVAAGRADVAAKVALAADALQARHATHSRRATAALCHGLAEGDSVLVAEAVESFRQAGRPWYQAQANEMLATMLAGDGQTEQARFALDDAIDLYTGFGAEWDIARADARLREFGIRRGRRGRRNRPKSGWQALTPTERKVAALVAQGLSNPEIATRMFLSSRTVQSHLSNILTKLRLQSRIQVVVALAQQGAFPSMG
ncbi:helix-turn-helix transcriptional regulator [Nocardia sp. NPDC060256]|uniref:helix-turn-helix transcriptional regulator n=1 Tax=unclassified Nocardia TaxID=2637762 RepID=UPI00365595E2